MKTWQFGILSDLAAAQETAVQYYWFVGIVGDLEHGQQAIPDPVLMVVPGAIAVFRQTISEDATRWRLAVYAKGFWSINLDGAPPPPPTGSGPTAPGGDHDYV